MAELDHGNHRGAHAAARDAAGTVQRQAQARNLARDIRDRVGAEARSQNDRLADGVRRFAAELDQVTAGRGPEGALEGGQDLARRRPDTFLLAAAAAGFVVGPLGKGVFQAEEPGGGDVPGYNGSSYDGGSCNGGAAARLDLLSAGTQPVPLRVEPVGPPTGGFVAEPVPFSTDPRQ